MVSCHAQKDCLRVTSLGTTGILDDPFKTKASSWACGVWALCIHTHKKGGLCHGFFTHLAIPSTLTSFIVGNEWSSYSSSQKMWRMPTVILATLFRLLPRCNIKMDSVFLKGIKSPWSGFSFPFLPIPAGDCFGELLSPWSPSPNTTSRL